VAAPRYKSNAGSVFNLNYHIVFCPKYRRKVLVNGVDERLKELILEKAIALGVEVSGLEVMPDHVHLFITAPPSDAPQHYVNQFKGYTSRVLRQEFPELKRKLPCLWSRSYYIGAAGAVTEDVVKRYIENQKGQ
jgi:putative transposase